MQLVKTYDATHKIAESKPAFVCFSETERGSDCSSVIFMKLNGEEKNCERQL